MQKIGVLNTTYCTMFESHTRVNISQQHMTCTLPYLAPEQKHVTAFKVLIDHVGITHNKTTHGLSNVTQ